MKRLMLQAVACRGCHTAQAFTLNAVCTTLLPTVPPIRGWAARWARLIPKPMEDMMTPTQVACVQQSFAQLRPRSDLVAMRFYQRLFTLDPSVRRLFPDDLSVQGRKLMDMLGLVVQGLRRPETVAPAVRALGRRHVQYGVRTAHYGTVGAALIWTLEQELGSEFTDEVREAWTTAYAYLAGVMTAAAGEPSGPTQARPQGNEPLLHHK